MLEYDHAVTMTSDPGIFIYSISCRMLHDYALVIMISEDEGIVI
jgi:hypothetical protein